MKEINESHQAEFDEQPQIVVQVPGAHTLLGEFTDYCKGYSICGTTSQTLELALSLRSDQNVRLCSGPGIDRKRFNIQNLKYRREDRWSNLPKGVMALFARRGVTLTGANITVSGSLLKSDSPALPSAICLATAMALNALLETDFPLDELIAIAHAAQTTFCGQSARYITFFALAYAKEGTVMLFSIQNLKWEYLTFPLDNERATMYLVESKIVPYALKEELSAKRKECQMAFKKLIPHFPNRLLRDLEDQEIKELPALALNDTEKRLCVEVLQESRLAQEGARLLAQNDMVLYGKVLNKVQAGLRDAFEVTCPEIDWLTKRAVEIPGGLGATMITTGSNGTVLILLPQAMVSAYTVRMEEYEHIFGFRPKLTRYEPQGPAKIVMHNI